MLLRDNKTVTKMETNWQVWQMWLCCRRKQMQNCNLNVDKAWQIRARRLLR